MKKCIACATVYGFNANETSACPECGCRRYMESDPIFGFDTPETVRKEAKEYGDVVAAAFDGKKIKSTITAIATSVIEVVEQFEEKDIEQIGKTYSSLVQAYGEVAISIMPVLKALSDITDKVKDKLITKVEEAPASEA